MRNEIIEKEIFRFISLDGVWFYEDIILGVVNRTHYLYMDVQNVLHKMVCSNKVIIDYDGSVFKNPGDMVNAN